MNIDTSKISVGKVLEFISTGAIIVVAVLAGHKVTTLLAKNMHRFLESEYKFTDSKTDYDLADIGNAEFWLHNGM